MKYLLNIHMFDGQIRTDIFFDSMEKVDEYITELRQEKIPFRKIAVYDAESKEAIKIIR